MKKFNLLLIALFVLSSCLELYTQEPIRIRLKQPPPNKLGVADIWNLELNNTSGQDMRIYLKGTATEEKDGLIIEGTSKVFTINPGISNYKYNDFSNAEFKYNNGKYKEIILRTGNAPEGSYTICVTAFNEQGEIVGMENCIVQNISPVSEGTITLISPSDGEVVNRDENVNFVWSAIGLKAPYTLTVKKVKKGQTNEQAMKENRVYYQKEGITTTSYRNGKMEEDPDLDLTKYVWRVSSGNKFSETFVFLLLTETNIAVEVDTLKCTNQQGVYNFTLTAFNRSNNYFDAKIHLPTIVNPSGAVVTVINPAPNSFPIDLNRGSSLVITGTVSFGMTVTNPEFEVGFQRPNGTIIPHPGFTDYVLNNCQLIACDSCGNGKTWYFGNGAVLNFGNPTTSLQNLMNVWEGCAVTSNNNGNVLLYTDGQYVWNANGVSIAQLDGGQSSTHVLIVPWPDSCNLYFVFTTEDHAGNSGLQFSVVDMNSGTTIIQRQSLNGPFAGRTCEKIAAIQKSNSGDYWLVAHGIGVDGSNFFVYEVTSGGITGPTVQTIGAHHKANSLNKIGQMKISPIGDRIAVAVYGDNSSPGFIEVLQFNNATGQVGASQLHLSNPQEGHPYGIEFSPNEQFLYYTLISPITGNVNSNELRRIDLQNNFGIVNLMSGQLIINQQIPSGKGPFYYGQLQLGEDGKIYLARNQETALGRINNPNSINNCDYDENGTLNAGICRLGLPTTVVCPIIPQTTKCSCEKNLIQNGNFTDGFGNWVFRSQSGNIQSPPASHYAVNQPGCCDQNHSNLWGNKVVGMTLSPQSINFQHGKKYKISFCARWDNNSNPSMGLIRFKFRASNGQFGWTDGTVIGISQDINSTSWTNYVIDEWTAPSNFNTLLITAENNSTQNDGNFVSWGSIDNICITEIDGSSTICNCKGGSWKEGVIEFTDNGSNKNARKDLSCDEKYGIIKVGKPVKINKNFICNPKDCEAKYDYKLIDNTSSVVLSGSNLSMPFDFTPPTTGQFVLEITPICGTDTCKPCEIKLIVDGKPECDCKEGEWLKGKIDYTDFNNEKVKKDLLCDEKYGIITVGQPVSIDKKFICNKKECEAKYDYKLIDNMGGVVISGSNVSMPIIFTPITEGEHKLEITPICGTDTCKPCIVGLEFSSKSDCNCNLNAWGPLPYSINGVPQTPAICGQSTINVIGLSSSIQFNPNAATFMCGPKSSTNCGPVFSWSITGPNGFSASGSAPNWGLSGFPSVGDYLLTVTPICGNVKCNPCIIKISVDDKKSCMFDVKIDSITCGPKDILGNQTYFVWSSVNNLTGVSASLHEIRPNSYISNLSSSVINPGLNNFNFTYSGPQSSPLCFEYRILRLDKNTDTCVYNVCDDLRDCTPGCCNIKLDPAFRGDTLCPGQTMEINWKGCTPTGIVSIMLIDVTNNRVHHVIATDVPAEQQSYLWTIPSNIQCNPILKWHFYVTDSQDRNCYTYGEDFYIRCCDEVKCDCRRSGWRVLQYSTNGGVRYNNLICNDSITITPKTQLTFNYEYLCPDPNCPVNIDWEFVNSANPGNILAEGNQINGFSLHHASYSTPGNYILTINPSCGDKGCSQCKIYIKVNGEG